MLVKMLDKSDDKNDQAKKKLAPENGVTSTFSVTDR